MAINTIIKNCNLVTVASIEKGNIAIKNGKIVAITDKSELLPKADRIIDAKGNYVIPGVVDPHVHLAYPDWPFDEDVRFSTRAAAAGGVSTVIHLLLEPGSLVKGLENSKTIFEQNASVDGAFHAAIFSEQHINEIGEVAKLGITSFKFAIPYRGAEVIPPVQGIDDGIVFFAFQEIAKLGYPGLAMVHAENIEIFFKYKERFLKEGRMDMHWHDTRPNFAEIEAMLRCIYFAKVTGCPLYIVHMTVREGPDVIRKAKAEGVNVIAETCPQYLVLARFDADRVLGKVNPPLRGKEDNEALWQGLRDGVIEAVGSDHAPCAMKHKKDFWNAIVGFAGLETMLPIMLSEGVNKGRISFEKLVEVCCQNPAKIFGIFPQKGTIAIGSDADLVIVDMKKQVKIHADKLHHISDFTPYEGMEVKGWPVLTMVRGNIVMEEGKIVAEPGFGRFVPASVPERIK